MAKHAKFDTDEIINVKTGKLSCNYKGYKGTFATLVYNCVEKRELPGFYYEKKKLVAEVMVKDKDLSLVISGKKSGKDLMVIMDIVMGNSSAFPVEEGEAQYSISIKGSGK